MWIDNAQFFCDMKAILNCNSIEWNLFRNSRVLVTGSTGLIGSTVVGAIGYASLMKKLNVRLCLVVRNLQKAQNMFEKHINEGVNIEFVAGSIENEIKVSWPIDYIIHCACPTTSQFFINNPVETAKAAICGTINMLDLAVKNKIRGFVYLSSMEAYGEVLNENLLSETDLGYIDLTNPRSCYPESKRMCEAICAAYASEYGLKVSSIRLAQSFGPGVSKEDKRVFAMMVRCALAGKDIELATKGTRKNAYLYTAQAVSAILSVLLKGVGGEIYNAANPETYCSVYEMGEMVAKEIADRKISVIVGKTDKNEKYPNPSFFNLNIEKIKKLGWEPSGTLADLYIRMIKGGFE